MSIRSRSARGQRRVFSIVVLATVLATFLAASTVPTPLYATYAKWWHLSSASITIAFAVYAVSLLVSLLVFGRLSERVGRRPVLLAAVGLQVVGAVVLLLADGYGVLLAGRIVQGVATGLGVGALSAAILSVAPRFGGVVNAAAPLAGSAAGGFVTAVMLRALPGAPQTAYVIILVALVAGAAGIAIVVPASARQTAALHSLRPTAGLPRSARSGFAAAAPVVFAVYALSGLFASLGPSLVQTLTRSSSVLLGVLPLVLMNVAAPASSIIVRNRSATQALLVGVIGTGAGVAVALVAILTADVALLWISAAVSGVGFGAGFRGGQQLILAEVPDDKRAEVVSVIYIVSYLGFGIPAVAAGVLDSVTGNLAGVAVGYCVVLLVLAVVSGVLLGRTTSTQSESDSAEGSSA